MATFYSPGHGLYQRIEEELSQSRLRPVLPAQAPPIPYMRFGLRLPAAEQPPSRFLKVPFADVIAPGIITKMLAGLPQVVEVQPQPRFIKVPVADVVVAAPYQQLRPLQGLPQAEPALQPVSLRYGIPMPWAPDQPIPGTPIELLLQRMGREPYRHVEEQFDETKLLQWLGETQPVHTSGQLFKVLRSVPLQEEVFDDSRFLGPFTADLITPLDILLLQRPRVALLQAPVVVALPRLVKVPKADITTAAVQLAPRKALPRIVDEPFDESRFVTVLIKDNLFYHAGQPLPLRGIEQVYEEFRRSRFTVAMPFELVKYFLPLQGRVQAFEVFKASKPVKVTPADILIPVDLLLQQQPRQGLTQADIVVGLVRYISAGVKDVFAPPSQGHKRWRRWHRSGG